MENFVYFTDAHYGAYPINRKDDYNQAILNKLEYCLKYASDNECIVLCGGDLFDTPKIKFFDLLKIVRLIRKYSGLKIYSLLGNESHDGLIDSSPLKLLKIANLIQDIGEHEDTKECRIVFANSSDNFELFEDFIKPQKVNILMTHGMIVKEPVIYEHTLLKDFITNFDIVTLAHYHPKQGIIQEPNGTVFLAPGALCRRKYTKSDIEKIPMFYHFIIDNGKLQEIKEIKIPFVKDVWIDKNEVDIDDKEIFLNVQKKVEEMKILLQSDVNFGSLEDEIKLYAKNKNLDQSVADYVIGRLHT